MKPDKGPRQKLLLGIRGVMLTANGIARSEGMLPGSRDSSQECHPSKFAVGPLANRELFSPRIDTVGVQGLHSHASRSVTGSTVLRCEANWQPDAVYVRVIRRPGSVWERCLCVYTSPAGRVRVLSYHGKMVSSNEQLPVRGNASSYCGTVESRETRRMPSLFISPTTLATVQRSSDVSFVLNLILNIRFCSLSAWTHEPRET